MNERSSPRLRSSSIVHDEPLPWPQTYTRRTHSGSPLLGSSVTGSRCTWLDRDCAWTHLCNLRPYMYNTHQYQHRADAKRACEEARECTGLIVRKNNLSADAVYALGMGTRVVNQQDVLYIHLCVTKKRSSPYGVRRPMERTRSRPRYSAYGDGDTRPTTNSRQRYSSPSLPGLWMTHDSNPSIGPMQKPGT